MSAASANTQGAEAPVKAPPDSTGPPGEGEGGGKGDPRGVGDAPCGATCG